METLGCTDSKQLTDGEAVCIRSMKPATFLRRFQRHIETSDWDEQIASAGSLFDRICLVAVILSGIGIVPVIIAVLTT
ncbi:MAG: hypothetical protein RBS58_06265 [Syntrophales bacterium]|jgi:hypothetical protein|nr:hypothetical protein [Syntrophales bacterium]